MDAAQLKADIVLLIDLITEHSRKVELVTHEDLQDEFLSKAPLQQPIPVSQIKAEYEAIPEMERKLRNKADDSPEEKERRRLISRRQMFGSLFSGELSLADLKEEPAEAESAPREITPEYFETVLAEVLKGQYGIEAVSYTHLDVYKRQILSRAAGRSRRDTHQQQNPGLVDQNLKRRHRQQAGENRRY